MSAPLNPLCAILLAAGASTRFGADKLLHPLLPSGTPLALAALNNLTAAMSRVIAVVRPESEQLSRLLSAGGAEIVTCENAESGIGASLACGVRAAQDCAGWVIALADMPRVRPQTILSVTRAIETGALIAAPHYRGTRGHPVGFSAALKQELLALSGDEGARSVIARHARQVQLIDCGDPGILADVDTSEDLPRL
jgi:molybdenum cofactor cytidylyltransferase